MVQGSLSALFRIVPSYSQNRTSSRDHLFDGAEFLRQFQFDIFPRDARDSSNHWFTFASDDRPEIPDGTLTETIKLNILFDTQTFDRRLAIGLWSEMLRTLAEKW